MRDLLIAALFHDFNHSGKSRGKDGEEIEVALMSLRHYILPEDRDRLIFISNIIKATQFPYVVPENELTISMRIIRMLIFLKTSPLPGYSSAGLA
ncbi:MAG: hypothetical protein R3B65_01675 [Candidatus Paceibacterota bacterium]